MEREGELLEVTRSERDPWRRRLTWGMVASALLAALAIGAPIALSGAASDGWVALATTAILAAVGFGVGASASKGSTVSGGKGRFSIAEDRVRITSSDGATHEIAPGDVERAALETEDALVLQQKRGPGLTLRAASRAALEPLLEHFAGSVDLVHRIRLLSPLDRGASCLRVAIGVALPFLGIGAVASWIGAWSSLGESKPAATATIAGIALGLTFLLATLVWSLRKKDLRVGADGLTYQIVRNHFVPYSSVQKVEVMGGSVHVTLDDDSTIELPVVFSGANLAVRALVDRIDRARRRAGASAALARTKLTALDRAGRSADAWRSDLTKITAGGGDYRVATFDRDELTRLVDDGGAPPERRVAAVLALRGVDEGVKRRVRVAAAATADPDLRAALEAAAEGEIAEEALARASIKRED
ncbi:MAG: hypothetical protein U0414_27190 [Polyangiaceae bacterium]